MLIVSSSCTIKDIAKHAGLSVGTVSGILNNKANFADETRARVWNIASELSYSPNQEAKKLRSGGHGISTKSNLLMYIVNYEQDNPQNRPSTQMRLSVLCMEAQKRGMFMAPYWYNGVRGFSCPPILNSLIDGVILGTPHQEIINILSSKNVPMVLANSPFYSGEVEVSTVNFNIRKGVLDMFKTLKELGHESIGICYVNSFPEKFIWEAVFEAVEKYDITIPREFMTPLIDLSPATHDVVMERFAASVIPLVKSKKISALFCSDDCYALSLYEILKREGIDIPGDFSIVGCGQLFDSQIASVVYDWSRLASATMDLLLELIENKKNNYPVEVLIPTSVKKGITMGRRKK